MKLDVRHAQIDPRCLLPRYNVVASVCFIDDMFSWSQRVYVRSNFPELFKQLFWKGRTSLVSPEMSTMAQIIRIDRAGELSDNALLELQTTITNCCAK